MKARSKARSAARLAAVQALYQLDMEAPSMARLLDEFHRHPMHPLRLATRVGADEIGMAQRAGHLRIPAKSRDHLGSRARRTLQRLQRDDAIHRDLPRLVHRASAALPEASEDLEVTESLPVSQHMPGTFARLKERWRGESEWQFHRTGKAVAARPSATTTEEKPGSTCAFHATGAPPVSAQ